MAVYYQHIGQKLAARDFPRSLGTREAGLRRFGLGDVEPYLGHLPPEELADMAAKVRDLAPTGFQVWGIPSGAAAVLAGMATGDFLLLLESTEFRYVGQVIHRASEMCWDLSDHIWGEQRFPDPDPAPRRADRLRLGRVRHRLRLRRDLPHARHHDAARRRAP